MASSGYQTREHFCLFAHCYGGPLAWMDWNQSRIYLWVIFHTVYMYVIYLNDSV